LPTACPGWQIWQVQGFVGRLRLPPAVDFIVATLEIGGAIAKFAGIITRITTVLYIIFMLSTTLAVKMSRGFVGGAKVDLRLLIMAVSLLITGPRRISVECDMLKREIWPRGRAMVPAATAKAYWPFRITTPGISSPAR